MKAWPCGPAMRMWSDCESHDTGSRSAHSLFSISNSQRPTSHRVVVTLHRPFAHYSRKDLVTASSLMLTNHHPPLHDISTRVANIISLTLETMNGGCVCLRGRDQVTHLIHTHTHTPGEVAVSFTSVTHVYFTYCMESALFPCCSVNIDLMIEAHLHTLAKNLWAKDAVLTLLIELQILSCMNPGDFEQ